MVHSKQSRERVKDWIELEPLDWTEAGPGPGSGSVPVPVGKLLNRIMIQCKRKCIWFGFYKR